VKVVGGASFQVHNPHQADQQYQRGRHPIEHVRGAQAASCGQIKRLSPLHDGHQRTAEKRENGQMVKGGKKGSHDG
jgi:hypothetical protein